MKTTIENALKVAKTPKPLGCGECNEMQYAPMDKLSIALYGKCSMHLEDDSFEEKNLLEISNAL